MLSLLNRFYSAEPTTKTKELNDVTKARMICVHWMRISVSDPNVSLDCLVSIVIKYYLPYPITFEWDANRTHDCLCLSKDKATFSTSGSIALYGALALLSMDFDDVESKSAVGMCSTVCSTILSADTVSVVRWELTVRQMTEKHWEARGIEFFMGFVDGEHIEDFKVGRAIGTLPHQAAFNPTQGRDHRDAMRVLSHF